jgi:triosephosphate isomerase
MRKSMIAANWKLHKTVPEAIGFLEEFIPKASGADDVDIVIAPVYTALAAAADKMKGTNVILSAQNVFYEEKGAYTGEISPGMLRDIGCEYVIIGHSERRQYFGDTDEIINKKIKAALQAGLGVIFCIGESLDQRQAEKTNDVLSGQIDAGLKDIGLEDIVIAYEPIWAIGTGVTATPEQAQDTHAFIRGHLAGTYDASKAEQVRILYGGSVKPDNVKDLMGRSDIDGALVGGASLEAGSFIKLVRFGEQ